MLQYGPAHHMLRIPEPRVMKDFLALTTLTAALVAVGPLAAQDSAAARGHKALVSRAFTPATWPVAAYDNLWKRWEPPLSEKPGDYDRAVREHYGLHEAPYDNGRYP